MVLIGPFSAAAHKVDTGRDSSDALLVGGLTTMPSLPDTADAVIIDGPGAAVRVARVRVVPPGPGEVIVRSHAAGICGSDLEVLRGVRQSGLQRYPVVPGHEWAGTVEALGPSVAGPPIGTAVVCEGLVSCGACGACRRGLSNICERGYEELGFTRPGGMARYVTVPARQLHTLPSGVTLDDAPLLEPAAVVAHAFLRAAPVPGADITVVGDGAVGLLAVQFARLYGAASVTLIGLEPDRMDLGRTFGADTVTLPDDATPGTADLVVETAGSARAVELSLQLARRGGAVSLVGVAGTGAVVSVPSDLFVLGHLAVYGVCGATPTSWDHALRLADRLALAELVSHRLPVAEAAHAFDQAAQRRPGTLKVLVTHE